MDLFSTLQTYLLSHFPEANYDQRIHQCLDLFKTNRFDYFSMIKELMAEVHLSESRLSHLFKKNVGISIKKYLVWSRLRKATKSIIEEEETFFSAALTHGFYDQAHLSKAFKDMLGVTPSSAYNSRTLQG